MNAPNQTSRCVESVNNDNSIIKLEDNSVITDKEKPLLDAEDNVTPSVQKEVFMTPFTAFSTIINIVLATGPFTFNTSTSPCFIICF